MRKLIVTLLVLLISELISAQELNIRRSSQSDECTMGNLYVNGMYIGYTLEREGKKIPVGAYSAFIRSDGKLGWRIELIGVPNKEYIQIHIGNYPWQTTGCTLLGMFANVSNCTISGSAEAMKRLENSLKVFDKNLELDKKSSQKYSITVKYE